MSNTKRNKYDEAAEKIQALYHQGVYTGDTEKISAILRSAFPPPAEDARRCAKRVYDLAAQGCPEDHWLHKFDAEAAAEIESFAQSRVEPWREALEEAIILINEMPGEPSNEQNERWNKARIFYWNWCSQNRNALLSDSPAKEAPL